jgi:hypothetical protein
MAEILLGAAAVAGTAATASAPEVIGVAATSGLFGAGGALTAGGMALGGMTTLGLGLGVAGIYGQGQAAASQAKGQQAVSEYNAKVQQQQAQAEAQATKYKGERLAEAQDRQASSLLAQAGAGGVVPSAGSPLLVQAKQAGQSELDRLILGYESGIAQQQNMNQAQLDTMQAGIYGQQAGNLSLAGTIGAGTSLLSGLTNFGRMKAGY